MLFVVIISSRGLDIVMAKTSVTDDEEPPSVAKSALVCPKL
jgi:hypothetical protein